MSALVLAEVDPWVYVGVTYVGAVGLVAGYATWILRRGRKINAQLPPDERRWM